VTASRYGVLSIPTVMLFEGGSPHETLIGARPKAHYQRAFARWLAAPAA
jgi:thioredoxin-like negative regulator of GroEL